MRNQKYRLVGSGSVQKKNKKSAAANMMLFDMEKDPSQTTDVLDQHPEIVEKMRKAYDAWWKETRPLMVNEEAPMSPVKPFHELFKKQTENGGIPDWVVPTL